MHTLQTITELQSVLVTRDKVTQHEQSPPVHSTVSTRKTSPSFTEPTWPRHAVDK